jgi:hypothetical protein
MLSYHKAEWASIDGLRVQQFRERTTLGRLNHGNHAPSGLWEQKTLKKGEKAVSP